MHIIILLLRKKNEIIGNFFGIFNKFSKNYPIILSVKDNDRSQKLGHSLLFFVTMWRSLSAVKP
jgi:hypothetical protein